MFSIYLITSPSGKQYIGITGKSVECRWRQHQWSARRGSKRPLAAAIRKYGDLMAITCVQSGVDSGEEAKLLEQSYIASYGTLVPSGYNRTAGGDGCTNLIHTEDTRSKISKNRIGKGLGHEVSSETREKISASKRGRPEIAAQLASVRFNRVGSVTSDEAKAKISAALRGRKKPLRTDEHKAAIGAALGEPVRDQNGVTYPSVKAAARSLGICDSLIHRVLRGSQHQTHGYTFSRANN